MPNHRRSSSRSSASSDSEAESWRHRKRRSRSPVRRSRSPSRRSPSRRSRSPRHSRSPHRSRSRSHRSRSPRRRHSPSRRRRSRSPRRQEEPPLVNTFKNDGSFMEMFKKMQQASAPPADQASGENSSSKDSSNAPTEQKKTSLMSFVGKRRGGRTLPTGTVQKLRKPEPPNEGEGNNDAWSRYLNEVRKYQEQSCEEEGKRRPLVK